MENFFENVFDNVSNILVNTYIKIQIFRYSLSKLPAPVWRASEAAFILYKNGLRSIGFGNRLFSVKDRFGELGDNENKAVVKTNKSDANPQDQLGHTLHPPG